MEGEGGKRGRKEEEEIRSVAVSESKGDVREFQRFWKLKNG